MNKQSGGNAVLIITVVITLLIVFIFGTVIGFNVAVNNIESCEKVDCNVFGKNAINATTCEICKNSILRIGAG